MDRNKDEQRPGTVALESAVRAKRPYAAPVLRSFGDVRSLTLGGSPGTGDSGGNPGALKSPTF